MPPHPRNSHRQGQTLPRNQRNKQFVTEEAVYKILLIKGLLKEVLKRIIKRIGASLIPHHV